MAECLINRSLLAESDYVSIGISLLHLSNGFVKFYELILYWVHIVKVRTYLPVLESIQFFPKVCLVALKDIRDW